jgi:hypothetical protein
MNRNDINLWSNLTFKTLGYRRNFDLVSLNENIITLYDGMVSEIRLSERKPPRPVGEYGFSVWNIDLAHKLGVDLERLIKAHDIENVYSEFYNVIKENVIDVHDYKKIVFVHSFVLNKNYRKHGITEEFVEMLYRDFYCDNTAIIMLVKPFQDNPIDADYYFNRKKVKTKESLNEIEDQVVSATEYYSLNELLKKDDRELNEYKLFTVANKCGFSRIDESYLFIFSPEKTLKRLQEKIKNGEVIENQ